MRASEPGITVAAIMGYPIHFPKWTPLNMGILKENVSTRGAFAIQMAGIIFAVGPEIFLVAGISAYISELIGVAVTTAL